MLLIKPKKKGWISGPAAYYAASTPTFNAWDPANYNSANLALSNSNLTITRTSSYDGNIYSGRSIANHSSGKVYAEFTIVSDNQNGIGICNSTFVNSDNPFGSPNSLAIADNGNVFVNSSGIGVGDSFTTGSVVGVAIDFGSSQLWFRVDTGNWNADISANPTAGTGGISWVSQGLNAGPYYAVAGLLQQANGTTANFGASAYSITAPLGFNNW